MLPFFDFLFDFVVLEVSLFFFVFEFFVAESSEAVVVLFSFIQRMSLIRILPEVARMRNDIAGVVGTFDFAVMRRRGE